MICQACADGNGCRGGGNKQCAKRNPIPSVLVGIIDTYGCFRTVVTHRKDVHHHVKHDEIAVIAPRVKLWEPIAWNDIPAVVERAHYEMQQWIKRSGIPNDPVRRECVVMYQLRMKRHPGGSGNTSFNPADIAYT